MPDPQKIPLSLYVHIPWCVRKCPYCDFNSHEGQIEEAAYVRALLADLEQEKHYAQGRPIHSIFFGGGTPSLFSGDAIKQILEGVEQRIPLSVDCEITLEANPGTVEQARFDAYREAGVNRLSIGAQSFDQQQLQRLGRIHNNSEAVAAAKAAVQAGFDNFNLDLMFALPQQTSAQALEDIEQALALRPNHISHYHLTLEPNTVFAKYPPADIPDEDTAWDIQDACHQRLQQAGYQNYEVSAWAQAGKQCAHNVNYWRFGDYLGIGAGAHGKVTLDNGDILRTAKKKAPAHYLRDAAAGQHYGSQEIISQADIGFEYALNRLRLDQAFDLAEVERYCGPVPASFLESLAAAENKELLHKENGKWQRSSLGSLHLNSLINLFH